MYENTKGEFVIDSRAEWVKKYVLLLPMHEYCFPHMHVRKYCFFRRWSAMTTENCHGFLIITFILE